MDDYQLHRQRVFLPYVGVHARGIEVGPGYRPTFAKAAGYAVTVVDHCGTAELIAKYTADTNVPRELVAQIEEVDVVWTEGSYKDLPGLGGAVDYIVASHVIEHTTDVCGFLMDCSSLLSDRGVLLLAIPDRSCVLDFYRPASTLGDVLLAHVDPQAYDVKSRMDEVWYGALLDGGGAWSLEHLTLATREGRVPLPQHGANVGGHVWMQSLAQAKARQDSASRAYRDAHRWALDPHSFAEIVGFLEVFAALGLHMEALPGGFGCEFYAVLRKQRTVVGVNSTELESVRSRAMQARRQRVVPPA